MSTVEINGVAAIEYLDRIRLGSRPLRSQGVARTQPAGA
jgi:hypothetical protein